MPPAAIGAGALAAGALGAGVAGAISSNNASKRAARAARVGQEAFESIALPRISEQELELELLKSMGDLNPELQENVLQEDTAFQEISEDPRLRKAQLDALSTLSNISSEGGMDAQAMATLAGAQSQAGQMARGNREALMQNAAARGVGGSGLEFVLSDQANQNAANQFANESLNAAAAAEARKMEALQGMAGLGGQMRSQDFNVASTKANAQDAINRFNATNRTQIGGANVDRRNTAMAQNLQNKQQLSNQNVALKNSQQQYNKELLQNKFDNEIKRAQGISGSSAQVANAQLQGGQAVAGTLGGIGQAALGAGATLFANQAKDPKKLV